MIGQVKMSYSTNDIINLIKRDIEVKFGQRALIGIDLGISDIYAPAANMVEYPEPEVIFKSVREQIAEMNLPTLPSVPRSSDSVTQDENKIGGSSLVYTFDRTKNTLTIDGGTVAWSNPVSGEAPKPGHWVGVFVHAPLGMELEQDARLNFSLDGRPGSLVVSESAASANGVVFWLDAQFTEHHIRIDWSQDYEVEEIVVMVKAGLEDITYPKYPAYPHEPVVTFKYPETTEYSKAKIKVDVDLGFGVGTNQATFSR